jgi:hypothetical protein
MDGWVMDGWMGVCMYVGTYSYQIISWVFVVGETADTTSKLEIVKSIRRAELDFASCDNREDPRRKDCFGF